MWVNRKIWPHQLQWLDQNIRRVDFHQLQPKIKWCIQIKWLHQVVDSMIIPNMLKQGLRNIIKETSQTLKNAEVIILFLTATEKLMSG